MMIFDACADLLHNVLLLQLTWGACFPPALEALSLATEGAGVPESCSWHDRQLRRVLLLRGSEGNCWLVACRLPWSGWSLSTPCSCCTPRAPPASPRACCTPRVSEGARPRAESPFAQACTCTCGPPLPRALLDRPVTSTLIFTYLLLQGLQPPTYPPHVREGAWEGACCPAALVERACRSSC